MLRNLVKKFKSQSLSESSGEDEQQQQREDSDAVMSPVRKSARLQAQQHQQQQQSSTPSSQSSDDTGSPMHSAIQPLPPPSAGRLKVHPHNHHHQQQQQQREPTPDDRDSGTESDDDELERIETTSTASAPVSHTSDYYASQQSLSIVSCRSHSPPLVSELETNSWDSMGCESGIVLRESDTDSTPTASELLYQQNGHAAALKQQQHHHHHHHHQQQQQMVTDGPVTRRAASANAVHSGGQGAFRPVGPRRQRSLPEPQQQQQQQSTTVFGAHVPLQQQQNTLNTVGEKRKWTEARKLRFSEDDERSSIANYATKLRSSTGSLNLAPARETLTAARRTPVRLLIPPPESEAAVPSVTEQYDHLSTSPSRSKRCRSSEDLVDDSLAAAARPSLDFEKMRERMMKPGAPRNKSETSSKAKLRSWVACHRRCPQTRCVQSDCLFRPLEAPNEQQQCGANNGGKTPTADTAGFSSSG